MNGENLQQSSQQPVPRWARMGADRANAGLPVKTPEGRAEITRRSRALNQRLRTVLLLVDGQRTISQIMSVAAQVGAPETCLDDLLEMGLVALPTPAARVVPAEPAVVAPVEIVAPLQPVAAAEPAMPTEPVESAESADASSITLEAAVPQVDPVASAPLLAALAPDTEILPEALPTDADTDAEASPADDLSVMPDHSSRLTSELFDQLVRAVPRQDTEHSTLDSTLRTGGRLDSMMSSLFPLLESAFGGLGKGANADQPQDDALEEARRILMREVRSKAPVTGALTLSKLRRASSREQLGALFDEVGSHISLPMRRLSTQQILLHVKGLLERPM